MSRLEMEMRRYCGAVIPALLCCIWTIQAAADDEAFHLVYLDVYKLQELDITGWNGSSGVYDKVVRPIRGHTFILVSAAITLHGGPGDSFPDEFRRHDYRLVLDDGSEVNPAPLYHKSRGMRRNIAYGSTRQIDPPDGPKIFERRVEVIFVTRATVQPTFFIFNQHRIPIRSVILSDPLDDSLLLPHVEVIAAEFVDTITVPQSLATWETVYRGSFLVLSIEFDPRSDSHHADYLPALRLRSLHIVYDSRVRSDIVASRVQEKFLDLYDDRYPPNRYERIVRAGPLRIYFPFPEEKVSTFELRYMNEPIAQGSLARAYFSLEQNETQ